MNDSDSSTRLGAADSASLLELYLERRDGGVKTDPQELIDEAGEDADALRSRLAILGELEQLSLLLSEDQGSVPDDLQELGRFERMRMIGQGGLSKVFFAHDPRLGRDVALKVLSPASLDSDVADLMLSEGRSLAGLEHDSIVRVFEIDEVEGFAYIAMEHVVGPSLHDTLEVMRAMRAGASEAVLDPGMVAAARRLESFPARCRLIAQLARALEYCHNKGTVHRDIKPGNILIDQAGIPKLIDFGLAHLESESEVSLGLTQKLVGTPAYITPEQVDEKRTGVSPRSDQFSLGIVLYELLTLVNPFNKDTREDTLTAISRANPPPLRKFAGQIPIDVERVCLHCLERLPSERYSGIGELADDLEAFLDYRAVSVQAPSLMRVAQLWLRRNSRQVRLATLVSVALITALGAAGTWRARAARQDIAGRARAALASVPELSQPREIEDALLDVSTLRERAAVYDSAALSGLILPTVGREIQDLADAASQRLNQLTGADLEEARRAPPTLQATDFLTALNAWKVALFLDANANPTSSVNTVYRNSGTITVPPGGVLRVLARNHQLQTFAETDPTGYLDPGLYRFTIERDGLIHEAEFFLQLWDEHVDRTPRPLAAGLRAAMLRCPGGMRTYDDEVKNTLEYTQQPFLVQPAMVTWAEVREVLGDDLVAKRHRVLKKLGLPAERFLSAEPANLYVQDAVEYGLRVGARLPTVPELVAAYEMGLIEPELAFELTSGVVQIGAARGIVDTAALRAALESAAGGLLESDGFVEPMPERALNGRAGFRLVISDSLRASGLR